MGSILLIRDDAADTTPVRPAVCDRDSAHVRVPNHVKSNSLNRRTRPGLDEMSHLLLVCSDVVDYLVERLSSRRRLQ
jgi:hypothetical protein